ncbi:ODA11 [Symbiodinium pilosum]|uniref:ODA11 protein n=1 Tax=Symbiodinium pilosum TaxID=2952 RepID=A0A812L5J3_SYMPI|nr:ODA11 [Symbiodinium pilosum]
MCYDSEESRLIMYGGWANKWLDDCWQINVASIVGPPYAIVHVDPPLGPVSGNQKVASLQMSTCVLALRKPQLVASLGGYIGIMEKNMETT